MPFIHSDGLSYFVFNHLSSEGVVHGIFTRHGGLSKEPWASLNMGGTVGDDPQCVLENRRRAFQSLGRPVESSFDVWQVHSTRVVSSDAPHPPDQPHIQADAIITNNPDVTLFMRFADCVPIILYDPRQKAIGLVHSGWQGTVEKIVLNAVLEMEKQFSTTPADLLAGIGPSIGPDHYTVGKDVTDRVRKSFGGQSDRVLIIEDNAKAGSTEKFDLWTANRLLLESCGVRDIEISDICTACHMDDWFSHRAEKGRTGRFGAMIGLKQA